MNCCILYNPLARGLRTYSGPLQPQQSGDYRLSYADVTKITDFPRFFRGIDPEEPLVICGGDGTVNNFVNKTAALNIKNPIYLFARGGCNDFCRELGPDDSGRAIRIDPLLKELPVVTVKGRDFRFLTGISSCSQGFLKEMDRLFSASGSQSFEEKVSALKSLLFKYRPCSATVTVDGLRHSYERVWMAHTLHGRFLMGGLQPAPGQGRFRNDGKVTTVILHDCGRLRSLLLSPGIFKGRAERYRGIVDVLRGDDVSLKFSRPVELQYDGEDSASVEGYRVRSVAMMKKALPAALCLTGSGMESVYTV